MSSCAAEEAFDLKPRAITTDPHYKKVPHMVVELHDAAAGGGASTG
jgi:hypothetical protein